MTAIFKESGSHMSYF